VKGSSAQVPVLDDKTYQSFRAAIMDRMDYIKAVERREAEEDRARKEAAAEKEVEENATLEQARAREAKKQHQKDVYDRMGPADKYAYKWRGDYGSWAPEKGHEPVRKEDL